MIATRAVVLARGLGTRMRVQDSGVALTSEQERAARAGLKAMMPVHGRPFLDYLLSTLADAGIRQVALVVAPEHDEIRHYYSSLAVPARVDISYIVQREALGTANAVVAAEEWIGGDPFLAMNGDNLYPLDALRTLSLLGEPGLPAFDREDLVRTSNIPEERIRAFALIEIGPDGYLRRIVEKPSADLPAQAGSHGKTVSMNCWRFDARIFAACRDVPRSVRGEYEVPEAVSLAMSRGVRFRAFAARGPVFDLSRRADMADVAARLAGVTPHP